MWCWALPVIFFIQSKPGSQGEQVRIRARGFGFPLWGKSPGSQLTRGQCVISYVSIWCLRLFQECPPSTNKGQCCQSSPVVFKRQKAYSLHLSSRGLLEESLSMPWWWAFQKRVPDWTSREPPHEKSRRTGSSFSLYTIEKCYQEKLLLCGPQNPERLLIRFSTKVQE